MTLDIYSHVVHSMQEEAAEKIGDVLFGKDPGLPHASGEHGRP